MKKILTVKIIFFYLLVSNNLFAGDTNKFIESRVLGAVSSLILPPQASIAISLLPFIQDDDDEKDFANKNNNSSIDYTNSINYINSLNN